MNITYFAHSILNQGGDRMALAHLNHLAEKGHNVIIRTNVLKTVFSIHPAINVRRLTIPTKIGSLLSALTSKQKADIIIASIVPMALLLAVRNGEKVLYLAQADDIEYYSNRVQRKIMDLAYRLYFKKPVSIITISKHLNEIFLKRYGFQRSHTVPIGIDIDRFYPEPAPDLLDLKGGKKAIFFMARDDHFRKGYDLAMRVFSKLAEDRSVAGLTEIWVCGERTRDIPNGLTVRHFGTVTDERLRQILSCADVFFYPSRHEGFGLFPLEAMACGCAVVTTDAIPYAHSMQSISTLSVGDVQGMADALRRLILDSALRENQKAIALGEARRYDVNESKIQFEKMLTTIYHDQDKSYQDN